MQPIDIAKAIDCLGDESVFRLTVESFLGETDSMIDSLGEAIESGNFETIKEKAHWIKGGLVYLHAGPSASAAKELEEAASGQDLSGVKSLFQRLNEEIVKLKKALAEQGPS